MITLQLDMYQACALGALVYCLGRLMVNKLSFLSKYCIPAPVAGGIVFAFAHLALYAAGILELSFDTTLQSVFMTVFFCSVGFTACFRLLKKGGLQVFLFLGLAVAICVIQDAVGSGLAAAFGLDPLLGLCMGSMPLVGGHGTSGSFGPLLEDLGVANANVVAIASATFGLVAGCAIGGPIATGKIKKFKLHSTEMSAEGGFETEDAGKIDSKRFLDAVLALIIAIGFGTIVSMLLGKLMTFPFYIGAMLVGAVIRNVADVAKKELPMEEIGVVGGFCLSVFLGLAMIDMKLWQLAELALPLVVMLAAQTVLMFLYANFVVFNVLGRNYDAAVMTTGFCGFGMGATPNAMANMQAVVGQYGPAPTAFMVVPLVGSLFIDFLNATILTGFINFLG